ncbi:MAG: ATP-binding protein [Bacteroidetes bacterium]|nr:ATP-binding protein [Bacteroidota bacterium]
MINRIISPIIRERFFDGKCILLLGARQTGKTTLVKNWMKQYADSSLWLNCDEPSTRILLEEISTLKWKQLIGDKTFLVLDEAQQIKNIGLKIKLITDQIEGVQVIITGSSSLELANEINEPLTGRKWEFNLFPISWEELKPRLTPSEQIQHLEPRLIFGMYPEIIMKPGKEVELLNSLSGSYLYKDLLSFKGIRKPELLERLLRALALQMGHEVSYNELSGLLQVDKNTIMNYIGLLEKAYIIFRLQPLSRNSRNEITLSRKIYFFDNGIRNAIISNFNPLSVRNDTGELWENFMISERIKFNHYHRRFVNMYFWRTYDKKEIDLVEESGGSFDLFEFKWRKRNIKDAFNRFRSTYPTRTSHIITPDNMDVFVTSQP